MARPLCSTLFIPDLRSCARESSDLSAQPVKSDRLIGRNKKQARSLAARCWFGRPVESPHPSLAELGRDLPASTDGASYLENSSLSGRGEFFNDPMLARLIHPLRVGDRERKILAQDVKDETDEPGGELVEHEA
jgi:hypothetical protein